MLPVRWSAPEWRHAEKTAFWYLASGAGAIIMIIIALWQKNILFAIFVVLAGFVTYLNSKRPPETRNFSLTDAGVFIDDKQIYKYEDLEAFALIDDSFGSPYSELVFKPRRKLGVFVKFLIPDEKDPEAIKFLETKLNTMEYHESLSETIMRVLGL